MNKTDSTYKSIGEVAKILNLINKKNGNLNTHTIRFWEKEFKQIKPKILTGKRRYYDQTSIEILKKVKYLLKEQGMTINGVKKLLNTKSLKLDEFSNNFISPDNIRIRKKLKNISNVNVLSGDEDIVSINFVSLVPYASSGEIVISLTFPILAFFKLFSNPGTNLPSPTTTVIGAYFLFSTIASSFLATFSRVVSNRIPSVRPS